MNGFARVIRKYQLVSYFAMTYAISWVLLLPFILTGNEKAFGILVLVGIFGPAFMNIIISRVITPIRDDKDRHRRRVALVVTWLAGTAVFTLNVKMTSGIESPIAVVFFALVALLPALVAASAFSKYQAVRESLKSILRPRGHFGWYLFALLMVPAIRLVGILISSSFGWEPISQPDTGNSLPHLIMLAGVTFSYGLIFTGGLNEEAGWTGFALPRLQARFSPLLASIILWFFWILWHMPMQIAGYWNSDGSSLIRALIGTFFARFIFTWLYNKTRGGILPAMLFHASANMSFAVLPSTHVHMVLEAVLAVMIVVGAKMWVKLTPPPAAVPCKENVYL